MRSGVVIKNECLPTLILNDTVVGTHDLISANPGRNLCGILYSRQSSLTSDA